MLFPRRLLAALLSAFWVSLVCASPSSSPRYQVYEDTLTGDLYLKADEILILLHGDIITPVKALPTGGLLKLEEVSSDNWVAETKPNSILQSLNLVPTSRFNAIVADFDGDGRSDLVLQATENSDSSFVVRKLGSDNIISLLPATASIDIGSSALIDINNDGILDFVTANQPTILGTLYGNFIDTGPLHDLSGMTEAVGMTSGDFAVSETGAATYNIKISVPQGTAGVVPEVSLSYSSQGGDSFLGVGWQLNAGSFITRCPQNMDQDGAGKITALNFSASDRFCLDGARLITASSNYHATDARYYTEIDSGVEVYPLGQASGHGPMAFKVVTKAGEIRWYGDIDAVGEDFGPTPSADAFIEPGGKYKDSASHNLVSLYPTGSVARAYALKAIQDVKGNYIWFDYIENQTIGEHFLSAISYTGNRYQSLQPYNRIEMVYDTTPRSKYRQGFLSGSIYTDRQRLIEIKTLQDDELFRSYKLEYFRSAYPEDREHLTKITECVSEDTCLKPLSLGINKPAANTATMVYEEYVEDVSNNKYRSSTDPGVKIRRVTSSQTFSPFENRQSFNSNSVPGFRGMLEAAYEEKARLLDFDGNGRVDLVYPTATSWMIHYDAGPTADILISEKISDESLTIDTNGDGAQELLYKGSDGKWWVAYINAVETRSACAVTAPACEPASYSKTVLTRSLEIDALGFPGNAAVLDIDGDGKDDIAHIDGTSIKYYLNEGGFFSGLNTGTIDFYQTRFNPLNDLPVSFEKYDGSFKEAGSGDFNGDGITDPVIRTKLLRKTCVNRRGSLLPVYSEAECLVDFNGVWSETKTESLTIYVGNGFGGFRKFSQLHGDLVFSVADFNGDGLSDLLFSHGGKDYYYRLSDGNGLLSSKKAFTASDAKFKYMHQVQDINGDGRADIVYANDNANRKFLINSASPDPESINFQTRGSIYVGTWTSILWGDINGDGRVDLFYNERNSEGKPTNKFFYHVAKGGSTPDYVLTSFTNGFGVRTEITYGSSTDRNLYLYTESALYKNATENAARVYMPLRGAFPLVKSVRTSGYAGTMADAIGANYQYGGGIVHKQGRGFLGYETLATLDLSSGIRTTTEYEQKFPLAGMPKKTKREMVAESGATWGKVLRDSTDKSYWLVGTLQESTNALNSKKLWNGAHFPYISQTVDKNWSLGKSTTGTASRYDVGRTVIDFTYDDNAIGADAYGNVTNVVEKVYSSTSTSTVLLTTTTSNVYNAASALDLPTTAASAAKRFGRLNSTTVSKTRGSDTQSRQSTFEYYNGSGMLKKTSEWIDGRAARIVEAAYDDFGNQTSSVTRDSFTKDSGGAAIPERRATTVYDARGQYVSKEGITGPGGKVEWVTYLHNGQSGESSAIEGRIWSRTVTSANGIAATQHFGLQGEVVRETRADGTSVETAYKYCGTSCVVPFGSSPIYKVETKASNTPEVTNYFDKFGREVWGTTKVLGGKETWVGKSYDDKGRTIAQTLPFFSGNPVFESRVEYDQLDRVVRQYQPETRGSVSLYSDGIRYAGALTEYTDASGKKRTETKNALGELVSVRRPGGTGTVDKGYDNTDQTTLISYTYDPFGGLKTATTKHDISGGQSQVVATTYDAWGRKIGMRDPDKGFWTYSYNGLGELMSETNNGRYTTHYKYDELGRMIWRLDPMPEGGGTAETTCWIYGTADHRASKAVGAPLAVKSFNNTVAASDCASRTADLKYAEYYSYDDLGRPQRVTKQVGTETFITSTSYNAKGQVADVTYPNGVKIGFDYDDTTGAQVKQQRILGTAKQLLREIRAQDAAGRVTQEALGGDATVTYREWDERRQFLRSGRVVNKNNQLIQELTYDYDAVGNLKGRNTVLSNLKAGILEAQYNASEAFTYDSLDRLRTRTVTINHAALPSSGTAPANFRTGGYSSVQTSSYDAFGNLRVKYDGRRSLAYCYLGTSGNWSDGLAGRVSYNRLTAVRSGAANCNEGTTYKTLIYDASGNVTDDAVSNYGDAAARRIFKYNSYEMMTRAAMGNEVSLFDYGPDRSLFKRVDYTQEKDASNNNYPATTIYERLLLGDYQRVTRTGGAGNSVEHKVTLGPVVITTGANNSTHFLHNDAQGSTISVTAVDAAGKMSVVQQRAYGPWGEQFELINTLTAMLAQDLDGKGYNGHQQIKGLNLVHMGGRVYDSELGRFLQADPFIQAPNNSQSYNRYAYVLNNPLSHTDPSGYFSIRQIAAIVIAVVATVLSAGAASPLLSFAYAVIGGALAGYVSTGTLKGAAVGAISAAIFYGIGSAFDSMANANWVGASESLKHGIVPASGLTTGQVVAKIATHAVAGGIQSKLGGGKFAHGFWSAGFTQAAAPVIAGAPGGAPGRIIAAAIVGGTASKLSGGKFGNGAMTGAFSRAFNEEVHYKRGQRGLTANERATAKSALTSAYGNYRNEEFIDAVVDSITIEAGGNIVGSAMRVGGEVIYTGDAVCADYTMCSIPSGENPGTNKPIFGVFVHEVMHVFQNAVGINVTVLGAIVQSDAWVNGTNPNAYDPAADPLTMNVEAQASYFRDKYFGFGLHSKERLPNGVKPW